MSARTRLILFALLAAVQLAVPAWMIAGREMTLRQGQVFRFKCAPVDPYDAFRGRFVALNLRDTAPQWTGKPLIPGQMVYALLAENPDGFARITGVSLTYPESGPCIRAKIGWGNQQDGLSLSLPFDRYYMDEFAAPAAELAYRDNLRKGERNAYVTVRVRGSDSVLEELYIDDLPVKEFLDSTKR